MLHLLHIWNYQIIDQNIFPVFAKTSRCHLSLTRVTQHQSKIIGLAKRIKRFERIMLKQILEQMNKYLSQNLCGYRKGFNTNCSNHASRKTGKDLG